MAFDDFEEISSAILARLLAAGWSQTKRSKESQVPELVYNSDLMRISVFQSVEGRFAMLTLMDIESDTYIRFEIRYGYALSSLLEILVEWQESVSGENFQSMINSIALEIPETYAEPFAGDEDTPWPRVIPS